jgi:hypothetical protein
MKLWSWIGKNDKQIKIIFAAVAAFYVLFEYRAAIHQNQITTAISYVTKHDEGKILESREHLYDFWLGQTMSQFIQQQHSLPKEERIKRYTQEFPQLVKASGCLADVYSLLSFYRDVALCVRVSNCDSKTICSYLFDDIQSFRDTYRPLLESWTTDLGETDDRTVGVLAEQACRPQFQQYCREVPASPYCHAKP